MLSVNGNNSNKKKKKTRNKHYASNNNTFSSRQTEINSKIINIHPTTNVHIIFERNGNNQTGETEVSGQDKTKTAADGLEWRRLIGYLQSSPGGQRGGCRGCRSGRAGGARLLEKSKIPKN